MRLRQLILEFELNPEESDHLRSTNLAIIKHCNSTKKPLLECSCKGIFLVRLGIFESICRGSQASTSRHPIPGRLYAIPAELEDMGKTGRCTAMPKASIASDR